jgi:hypothetical protein
MIKSRRDDTFDEIFPTTTLATLLPTTTNDERLPTIKFAVVLLTIISVNILPK